MAHIQPFAALMFDPACAGALSGVICPPYDVISASEQARLHDQSPYNVVRLELGRDDPGDDNGVNRYSRAGALLAQWLVQGVLREDSAPAFYVYDQSWGERRRRAFFAAVRLAPWSAGEVLPHEQTLTGPKQDRLALMRHTGTNLSPVMGLYDDADATVGALLAEATLQEPLLRAKAGGEVHEIWRLDAWDGVAAIQETLASRPIFIADGHHRYETALTYRDERRDAQGAYSGEEPWNFVLMALCSLSDPGLVVLPTHRLVRAPGLDASTLLARLKGRFEIETIGLDADLAGSTAQVAKLLSGRSHGLAMVVAGLEPQIHFLHLAASPEAALAHLPHSRPWRELSVAQLHYLVIADVLGIPESEWKSGQHIVYTRDCNKVLEGVGSGEFQVGFFLDATPIDQIKRVSLAGDVMPQKATYFFPKLPTGLVLHRLDEQPALPEPLEQQSDSQLGAPSP